MPFPKITEAVMGVLKNPQKEAENVCKRCKDYITSITPNKSAPLNKEEVKELYLKLRTSGVDHIANIFHRSIGHSSLCTLQRLVNSML